MVHASEIAASKYHICRHIKTDGHRCQAPALTGSALCYFHRTLFHRHARVRAAARPCLPVVTQYVGPTALTSSPDIPQYPSLPDLDLPPLEDAESVQLAISVLFASIAAGQVDPLLARTLLYALQLATFNVRALAPVTPAVAVYSGPRSVASDTEFDGPASTIVRRVVRTRGGQTLAALEDGNGIPSEAARPKTIAERLLDAVLNGPQWKPEPQIESDLYPQPNQKHPLEGNSPNPPNSPPITPID